MSQRLYTNFGDSELQTLITESSSSMEIAFTDTARFPTSLASGETFRLTLWDGNQATLPEIVEVTAVSSNVFTITRGKEGTAATEWVAGTQVRMTMSAEAFQEATYYPPYQVPEATATGNNFTLTVNSMDAAQKNGQLYTFKAPSGNTGSVTVTLTDGATTVTGIPVVKRAGSSLSSGDINAGDSLIFLYDNTVTSPGQFFFISDAGGYSPGTAVSIIDGLTPVADRIVRFTATGAGALQVFGSRAQAFCATDTVTGSLTRSGFTATMTGIATATSKSAARTFLQITDATATQAGRIEKATASEVRAGSAGAKAITPDVLAPTTSAVSLIDAATVAIDWSTGIYFTVALTANRTLGFPSNLVAGTSRQVWVSGTATTARTLSFATTFGGTTPTLDDISSTQKYLLNLQALTTSQCIVTGAVDAS